MLKLFTCMWTFSVCEEYKRYKNFECYFLVWVKVFKGEPSKICGRQPFKTLRRYSLLRQTISLDRPYHFKFFKGCFSQVLLGLFLNTLIHLSRLFNNPLAAGVR